MKNKGNGKRRFLKCIVCIFGAIALLLGVIALINAVHRSNMEKYIDGYARVEYEHQLVPSVDERGNYTFTTDGELKVMQLTDIHLGGGFLFADGDKRAIHAVAAMIAEEKPDHFIVVNVDRC